jgi:hypothetical protein
MGGIKRQRKLIEAHSHFTELLTQHKDNTNESVLTQIQICDEIQIDVKLCASYDKILVSYQMPISDK